jgi:quercetin dioxygenase-like cupin family protein
MVHILKVREAPTSKEWPGMAPGGRTRIDLITQHLGAKNMQCQMVIYEPGGFSPYHYHLKAEHAYFILKGRAKLIADGKEHELGQDTMIFIPPGEKHKFTNIGQSDMLFLEFYSPPGPDFIEVPEKI